MKTIAALAGIARPPQRRGQSARARGRQRSCGNGDLARRDRLMSGLTGFAVVLLGWQVALWHAFLFGVIDLGGFAATHLVGCAGLMVGLVWRSMRAAAGNRATVALQMVAWSLVAGPFGSFVAVALVCPSAPGPMETADSDSEDPDGVASERAERVRRAVHDRRVRIAGACQARPLIDVVADGSLSEKLEAVALVYRRYDAGLSAVLKRALRDSDMSVRVLAATVTAKLNAIYGRKVGDCQQAAASAPNVARSWRDIAVARLAYAESGLLEAQRARAEIESAIGDLARAAELDAGDRESYELLDRTRRKLTRWSMQELERAGSP